MSTRRVALIATALAALALLIPASGSAVIAGGCGAEHVGKTSCTFAPTGVGLRLSGYAPGSWVTVTVFDPAGHTLASCYGFDACSTSYGLGLETIGDAPLPAGGPLKCEVQSDTAGAYSCSSSLA